ncbi:hypothetical protein LIER_39072 [Lithospermum erythrorhizon]|uniref:Uncharacterized protein n=1 Tax=Lithospermum erythrorhizon TaxID=34254 RepID=A0AAV3Q9G3_LITER
MYLHGEQRTCQAWTLRWFSIASTLTRYFTPIKQRKRTFSEEKNLAIKEEVANLLKADAIRELQFPSWIANVMLVKKRNNKWQM